MLICENRIDSLTPLKVETNLLKNHNQFKIN